MCGRFRNNDQLLLGISQIYVVYGEDCKQSVEVADQCARHISIFGNPDVIIPVTEADMDRHCNLTLESIRCLRRFGRQCLPTFPRQALGIFTKTLRNLVIKRCRRPSFRKEFLEIAKCWKPKERLHKTHICVDKHIIQLEYISKRVVEEFQIPAICCTFQQRNACIKRELSQICSEENVNYVMRMISDSMGRLTAFACSKYLSIEACDRYFASDVWLPLKDVINTDDEKLLATRHHHQSVLAPIVEIVTQFKLS